MVKRPDDLPGWEDADRISDRIIELSNEEVGHGVSPLQVFAGVMLGLMGILRSAPEERPLSMVYVESALRVCLDSLIHSKRPKPHDA
jgi:hypothetical protein